MAEPTTLEDAYEGYKANRFSRKDLFGFIIDRVKATEVRQERLEGQMKDLVAALVRGMKEEAPEPAQAKQTQSERMKEIWARKKAQAVADGVGEAVNG